MDNGKIQLTVREDFRKRALKMVKEKGFSSLEEALKMMLISFVDGRLKSFAECYEEEMNPAKVKEYKKMKEELRLAVNEEKVRYVDSWEDFMKAVDKDDNTPIIQTFHKREND